MELNLFIHSVGTPLNHRRVQVLLPSIVERGGINSPCAVELSPTAGPKVLIRP